LANGGWTYKSNQYGYTTLICPINFSGNTASKVTGVILVYRDDWVGADVPFDADNGYVEAKLMMRNRSASGFIEISEAATSSFLSDNAALNNSSAYSYDFEAVTQQSAIPSLGKIYYLEVRMGRPQVNGNFQVAFMGYEIRF
jgi:hypothetical protein